MAQSAWPFGDQGVTDDQYRRYARTFAETKVHEGLTVSANSTGMQVQVSAGFATVQGLAYYNDASAAVTIAANNTSYPRVDTVVLRLDYTTTPQIQLGTVQGTPNLNPQKPTLTQTDTGVFEFPLAQVAVAAGAVTIASSNVSGVLAGAGYRWVNGTLKLWDCDDVSSLITIANFPLYTNDGTVARLANGVVTALIRVGRSAGWAAPAWGADPCLTIDSRIAPATTDFNIVAQGNTDDSQRGIWGFQLNQRSIKVRNASTTPHKILSGTWLHANLAWPIA